MTQIHIIERAFQLADQSGHETFNDIRIALTAEGYGRAVLTHLDGVSIRQQLRARIAARPAEAA